MRSRSIRLGNTRLTERWGIEPYSKYSPTLDTEPRIFVTNPGWMLSSLPARVFGAVIVDGSHPRTLAHIKTLLAGPLGGVPIQVVATPPLEERQMSDLTALPVSSVWLWDPESQRSVVAAVTGENATAESVSSRTIWCCDDDPVDEALRQVPHPAGHCDEAHVGPVSATLLVLVVVPPPASARTAAA